MENFENLHPNCFTEKLAKEYSYEIDPLNDNFVVTKIMGINLMAPEVGGIFIAIENHSGWMRIGNLVRGIGEYGKNKGMGIITSINCPHFDGETSNIIYVHFVGNLHPSKMKPHEIENAKF